MHVIAPGSRTVTAAILVAAAATFPAFSVQPAKQPVRPTDKAVVTPDRSEGRVLEPADSYSAQLRREQEVRKELRRQLNWSTLTPEQREGLREVAVGPDVLPEGEGNGGGGGNLEIPLVELSWIYTGQYGSTPSRVADLNLNVRGNVVMAGDQSGPNNSVVVEIDGTRDQTQGWGQNWAYYGSPSGSSQARTSVCDLLGVTYFSGKSVATPNHYYPICRLDSGTLSPSPVYTFAPTRAGANVDPITYGIEVDPEGLIYVCGANFDPASGLTYGFVSKHNPANGMARVWGANLPGVGWPESIKVNRRGDIFVAGAFGATNTTKRAKVQKLDPYTGQVVWTSPDDGLLSAAVGAMALDFDGNPYITAVSGGTGKTTKFDQLTGQAVWFATGDGNGVDLIVDGSGNVFTIGQVGGGTARINKYDDAGVLRANQSWGTTTTVKNVALDWVGNPYVCDVFGSPNRVSVEVRKFVPTDLTFAWTPTNYIATNPLAITSEVNIQVDIADMVVDAGGSIYVGGTRTGSTSYEAYVVRYEQPYVAIPQIARFNPNLKVEGHSVWLPHLDDLSQNGFLNTRHNLFNVDVDAALEGSPPSYLTPDDFLSADIDYVLGTVHGELDLDLSNNTLLGVDFVTSATGGSYDATATGTLQIGVPGEEELTAGRSVPITIDFEPDPNGMEMIANTAPALTAEFQTNASGLLNLHLRASNHYFTWPNPPDHPNYWESIFDYDLLGGQVNLAQADEYVLYSLFNGTVPPPGQWVEFERGPISGKLTSPNLRAEATYTSNARNGADNDHPELNSTVSQQFCEISLGITDPIAEAVLGVPLSISYSLPAGGDGTEAGISAGLLQASLNGTVGMQQTLNMVMTPYVKLTFPGANPAISDILVDLVRRQSSNGKYSYQPQGAFPQVTMPATGRLEIKPYFGVKATVQNTSGMNFGASFDFDPFAIQATLSVLGVSVIDIDQCWGCQHVPIVDPDHAVLNLYDYTSPEFSFTAAGTDENLIELPSVMAVGSASDDPQLIGCSRDGARMIIYDQVNTDTPAELAAVAGGTEPMVLYGRKFFGDTTNTAKLSYYGRQISLTTTRLNEQSLLVEVPRRFFLLPGTARIWVENGYGNSETIDFEIGYPIPNFTGPSEPIWAGDPKWTSEPVIAVDGGTPAGNDSFIARRDYFTRLRTLLWSPGLFAAGEAGRNQTAQAYFPSFQGWELNGRPKSPPGFPTLTVLGATPAEDVALGRYRRPGNPPTFVNDGLYRSTLQQGLYASPRVMNMVLVNPGPGGGPSRTIAVSVPAPEPVLLSVSPSSIAPDSLGDRSSLRIVVTGPDSVPYFTSNGVNYETPKGGNFTPESVVKFAGVAMPTTFISSSQLAAEVPVAYLSSVGARLVTVFTPSGGVSYFEQLRTGEGTLLPGAMVPGGGESVPLTFDVTWGTPIIKSVSQASITAGQAPYFPTAERHPTNPNYNPAPDGYNFSITGKNFAPGCTVSWNGRVIPSSRTSDGLLRATLTDADVAAPGTARIWVNNPTPNRRSSRPFDVQIVP